MFKRKRLIEYSLLSVGILLFVVFMAKAFAQNVTQGYVSDSATQPGMIVRLVTGDASKIEPLDQVSETEMLGVVVASSQAPVSLSSDNTKQQTYVATSGQYDVLVSNQNGVIKNGDLITISSIDGVGMKADTAHQVILGKAVEGYDGKSAVQSTASLKTSGGNRTVTIGRIKVNIDVAHNPEYQPVTAESGVPGWLASAAQIVTNKPVGPARIYASLIIVLVCTLITGSLLYAGVRTSLTSIGRNPLARKSIVRNLLQVVLISLIIFTIGLIAVYLVLRI